MTHYFNSASSMNAQIKNTQQHILNHQRAFESRKEALAGKIQQQKVKPANLLLAASVGFIVGELTQCRCGKASHPRATETSPLENALSLIGSVKNLYAALPLVLMIKSLSSR